MKKTLITLLLTACAVAAGAATAGAAAVPLQASFGVAPERPRPGEPVVLTSTTTPQAESGRSYAWDLDADGQFDDGTGPSLSTSFAQAGEHVVRLRATQGGLAVQASTAERTVSVVAAGGDQPPPPPPPAPTPPSPSNQAPEARLDLGCKSKGGLVLCGGMLARHDTPHTFDATPSADADGAIVRYEWDLQGDGTYDHDTGATPTLTQTFRFFPGHHKRTVRVRVTDDKGATDTADLTLTILPPGCVGEVTSGLLKASGTCLRPWRAGALTSYRSDDPVTVNGIILRPGWGGLKITLGGVRPRIESPNAEVIVPVKQTAARLFAGRVDWSVGADGTLGGFELGSGAQLNHLRITGMPSAPRLRSGASSELRFHVALPADFGGATTAEPVVVRPNAAQAAAGEPLRFEVPAAAIGPIGMKSLVVEYDGDGLWEINGTVAVPAPIPLEISGGAGIDKGAFHHAEAEVTFPGGGLGPFGPVYLQRIKFRVEVKPKKSECVPKIGLEQFDLKKIHDQLGIGMPPGLPRYFYVDHGVPAFALCGEIELTGGPKILGVAAVSLDAGLGFATFDDRPSILRAFGDISVLDIPLAKGSFEVHGDGWTKVRGDFHIEPFPGVISLGGFIDFEMRAPKFNAEAYVEACIEFAEICAGAHALFSSKGVAICAHVDVLGANWTPGVGYRYGDTFPDLIFHGCDVGPYKEHIEGNTKIVYKVRAAGAAGAGRTIDLPAGLPGATIVARGRDGVPKLTLVGPNGERIETPADANALKRPGVFLLKVPQRNVWQVALARPAAGRWTVEVVPDSPEVVSLRSAEGLDKPKVDARVNGAGQRQVLEYALTERPGQKVTFVERGASAGTMIGTATGSKGRLAFTPGAGKAERRTIVAIVEQDGFTRDEVEVASYRAPSAPRAGRVGGLKVRRRGGAVVAAWMPSAGAKEHEVALTLSDGRRRIVRTRRSRLTLPRIARGLRGTVTVRGLRFDGRPGAAARARLRG